MSLDDSQSIHTIGEKLSASTVLRAELKEWEKAFLAAHGRKAGRDDIKKDPKIAQKYKDYAKLRPDKTSKLLQKDTYSPAEESRKRTGEIEKWQASTPKRQRYGPLHPAELDPYDAPLQVTPSVSRTFVGPTPQKNGQVLGLFDLLSPENAKNTPSKSSREVQALGSHCTPSRRRSVNMIAQLAATPSKSISHTPRSSKSGKASDFLTPSARRFHSGIRSKAGDLDNDITPEFLRRTQNHFAADDGIGSKNTGRESAELNLSPIAVRMPPKPAGTGLSDLVRGLRNMEEQRLDDEMDILHDLEAEENGSVAPKRPTLQIKDSQLNTAQELPLGADGENEMSDEDEALAKEGLDRHGRPLKVWKKRGQKRTTRKVNIKPTTAKWKPEPAWEPQRDAEGVNDEVVGEGSAPSDDELNKGSTKRQSTAQKSGDAANVTKTKTKKVAPTANPNFRALKIQKKGGKFKGRGRFGRR